MLNFLYFYLQKSFLTQLFVLEIYITNCHAGILNTLSLVREFGWLLRGGRTVKQVSYNLCIPCRKLMVKAFSLLAPPPLPRNRVCPSVPFLHTGVDYCGSFSVRLNGKFEKI